MTEDKKAKSKQTATTSNSAHPREATTSSGPSSSRGSISPYGSTRSQTFLHSRIEHLHGPEEVPYAEDELVVVCLVRDGRPYVRSYVEHYFALGVKHLFFLDNNSTDGTVEALKNYDNTTVLCSKLPFKEYMLLMKQYLIGRFGKKDRWCLYADIDEHFDYPYSDVIGLGSLLRYLTEKSYT